MRCSFVNTHAETDTVFTLSPLLSEAITHKLPGRSNSLDFAFKCFQAERADERGGREKLPKLFFFFLSACVFCFVFSIFLCSMGKYNLSVVDMVRHFFPPSTPPAEKRFNINLFACSKRSPSVDLIQFKND